jgi:hypothetical protein
MESAALSDRQRLSGINVLNARGRLSTTRALSAGEAKMTGRGAMHFDQFDQNKDDPWI